MNEGERRLVEDSTWDWSLYREPDGSLLPLVVCGIVGLFEVEGLLDEELTAAYEREGRAALLPLVREVRDHPERFATDGSQRDGSQIG